MILEIQNNYIELHYAIVDYNIKQTYATLLTTRAETNTWILAPLLDYSNTMKALGYTKNGFGTLIFTYLLIIYIFEIILAIR